MRSFAKEINASHNRLDILINNAGVMACPFSKTQDGFEIQMGTNHLGYFTLTGLLMPLMRKIKGSRIVVTSSIAHRQGDINFEDINWEKREYVTNKAYGDSKLANLYFAYEGARKFKDSSNAPIFTAAHPGWTSTELQRHSFIFKVLNPFFSQDVASGVLPNLRAAVDGHAKPGDYFGPSGWGEVKGSPVIVKSNEMSHNLDKAKQLWDLSEKMIGVTY